MNFVFSSFKFEYAVDMYRWMKMMEKEISMFAGLYWAHDQIDHVMLLKEKMPTYNYIIATGISMMGYMMQGFDAISMMAMNVCPEMMKEMYDHMMNYRMREAMMLHGKMSKRFWDMMRLDTDMDWVTAMKLEMNKIMNMGPLRKPKMTMNRWWNKRNKFRKCENSMKCVRTFSTIC